MEQKAKKTGERTLKGLSNREKYAYLNQLDQYIEECEEEYKFDIKKGLLSNIFWLLSFFSIYILIVISLLKTSEITDQIIKVLYLIVMMFVTLKLLGWVGHPNLYFKRK